MRSALALALALVLTSGCAYFDGPPEASIQGLKEGLLADPHGPIVLAFSKPPVASTVNVKIARYIVDTAGRLGDEPGNTLGMPLDTLFIHDPMYGDTGGAADLAADGSTMTITPAVVPPVGGQLVVLIEPGIADATGAVTKVRRRLVFGYASMLQCNAPVHVFRSGTYFLLVAVDQPVHAQLQLFAQVQLDATTGQFKSRFTKARRNPDPARCQPACASTEVCRLVPAQACVTPSTPAESVDELSDYVPNDMAPTGFSFANGGCAVDQDAMTSAFATSPVDVDVTSPMVTLRNASQTASFKLDSDGTLRGTGSLSADAVLLGTIDSGKGHGNLTARSIADKDVPPGVPGP